MSGTLRFNIETMVLNALNDAGFLVDFPRKWVGLKNRTIHETEIIAALDEVMASHISVYRRNGKGFILEIDNEI